MENHPGSVSIDSLLKLLSALDLELVLEPKEARGSSKQPVPHPEEEW
jgi:hypothetical protein